MRGRVEETGPGARQESRNLQQRRIWDKEGRNRLGGRNQENGKQAGRVQTGSQPSIHLVGLTTSCASFWLKWHVQANQWGWTSPPIRSFAGRALVEPDFH